MVRALPSGRIGFQLDAGIWIVTPDGERASTVMPGPLPRGLDLVELAPSRAVALFRTGPDFAELVDVATGKPRFTITVRGHGIQHLGRTGSDTIALSDASGQVFAVDASGITPRAGREVAIYDLDRHGEIAHYKLGSTITALAWSGDGKQLAAAAPRRSSRSGGPDSEI